MGKLQGMEGVLFDEADGQAFGLVQMPDGVEDLFHNQRRKSERWFIEQQETRAPHQRAGN